MWHIADPRAAWRERQQRILAWLEANPAAHLLVMDVAKYYPSLGPGPLTLAMNCLGVTTPGIEDPITCLDALNGPPGRVGGVPIGPEASSVLGTAGLISVDRLLAGHLYVRFADDIWVVNASRTSAEEAGARVTGQLKLAGLRANPDKQRILSGQDAIDHITDAEIDYVARPGHRAGVAEAMDLIHSGIAEQKLSRVRFGLGALKHHQSVAVVPMLLASPGLIDADPKAFGSYIGSVIAQIDDDDRETLVDLVAADTGDHQIGRRIHIAAALARGQLNEGLSRRLHEAAIGMVSRKHQLIRTHALVAACRGVGVEQRLNEGLECAEATDSLDLRRAVGDAHHRVTGRRRRVGIDQLCRIDPEVRPFLQHLR